jgi:hypothetical protein
MHATAPPDPALLEFDDPDAVAVVAGVVYRQDAEGAAAA